VLCGGRSPNSITNCGNDGPADTRRTSVFHFLILEDFMKTDPESKALTDAERKKLLADMPEDLQPIAQRVHDKLKTLNRGDALTRYDIGVMLTAPVNKPSVYGMEAIEQVAEYAGVGGGRRTLYDMVIFAKEFTREFVEAEATKPLPDGSYLSFYDFCQLAKVTDPAERKRLLKRIREENLSIADIRREIAGGEYPVAHKRAGRRKVKPPTSPISGLHRLSTDAGRLADFVAVMAEPVFEKIIDMTPDTVKENMLTEIEKAQEAITRAEQSIRTAKAGLQKTKARVKTVLRLREEQHRAAKEQETEGELVEV
jgi:hypothetical protein